MKNKNKSDFIVVIILMVLMILLVLGSLTVPEVLKNNPIYYIICIAFVFIAATVILLLYGLNDRTLKTLEKRMGFWNTISYRVKSAGENAFNNLPIGIIVLDDDFNIAWSNEQAKKILHGEYDSVNIKNICNGELEKFVKNTNPIKSTVILYENIYEVNYDSKIKVFYLTDKTGHETLIKKNEEETLAFGYINIDNYDESIVDMDVQQKMDFTGDVVSEFVSYFEENNGYVRGLSDTQYILLCSKKDLEVMMNDNFSIIDKVKDIGKKYKAFITISIGICCNKKNVIELSSNANQELELVLARGGDQVAVKLNDTLKLYGGKTDGSIPTTNTNIRFKYEKLVNLINDSSFVYIVGHRNQDADAFGSSIALHVLCNALNKKHKIILSTQDMDNTVLKVYKDMMIMAPDVYKLIEDPSKLKNIQDNSLLIIVDCQSEASINLGKNSVSDFDKVAVLDHHRKNDTGTLESPTYTFFDTAASSTIELLVQAFSYSDLDLSISAMEATWMVLGIVVDTNNFVYRTSENTFEVVLTLNKYQADMSRVKEYLKEDVKDKMLRNEMISNIERYRDIVAISVQKNEDILTPPTIAKISDELLGIEGIELACTIARSADDTIRISARSLNRFNCQLLMEKLGGGGHFAGAACQLKDYSKEEVVTLLKSAIDDVINENDSNLSIILTSNSNKGARGDTISLPYSEAFALLNSNEAVLYTKENSLIFEQEREINELKIKKEFEKKSILKKKIENFKLIIKLDLDKKQTYRSIIDKIITILHRRFKVQFKRSDIQVKSQINSYGTYDYTVKIYQNLIAEGKLFVIGK